VSKRILVVAAGLALGCGPSFQAIYEGDARFEHCYALEETAAASMQQKAECWREWTQRHTYGQTRDRVEYAASRYRALTKAPDMPTDEAMMEAAPGVVDTSGQLAAPAPTSAFAPPPVMTTGDTSSRDAGTSAMATVPAIVAPPASASVAPAPSSSSAPAPRKPKAAKCVSDCDTGFDACASQNDGDVKKCDAGYSRCIEACTKQK